MSSLPDGVTRRALREEDAALVAELLVEYERSFGHEPSHRRGGHPRLVAAHEPRRGLVAARGGGNGRRGRLARAAGR